MTPMETQVLDIAVPALEPVTYGEPITSFSGDFAFLSIYYPCEIEYEGMLFSSALHAFCAARTPDLDDKRKFTSNAEPILVAAKAEALSKTLPMRKDWMEIRNQVLDEVQTLKFSSYKLSQRLLSTEQRLLSDDHSRDRYLGHCHGKGDNQLGKVLMRLREEIRERQPKAKRMVVQ